MTSTAEATSADAAVSGDATPERVEATRGYTMPGTIKAYRPAVGGISAIWA